MKIEEFVGIVMSVLTGLKNECSKYECCTEKCDFYVHDIGTCLLKECPCDYDLSKIKKTINTIVEKETNKNE